MPIKRLLIWLLPLVLIVLLALPAPVAERYTSPTQDGQYLFHPVRAYGFILTLARVSGSASLGNSGKALEKAKSSFGGSAVKPTKVELLYLPGAKTYAYVTRSGETLTIERPPKLVWEIWGTVEQTSAAPGTQAEVVGFIDYETGDMVSALKTGSP